MPIYMDRHDLSGATAKDVAQAHQEDLKIQEQYGCKGLTYWFDEERGAAFCLVEAPNQDSVSEMHKHAHGLVPHQIIEVESNIVESFLGRIQDPKPANDIDDSGLLIINDPAFRAILAIELEGIELLNHNYDHNTSNKFSKSYSQLIEEILSQFKGIEVEHVKDGLLNSFNSISNAVDAAMEFQTRLQILATKLGVKLQSKIGLSAGVPVTKDKNFFGETIQESMRLCKTASGGQIMVSSSINNYLSEDKLNQLTKKTSVKVLKPAEQKFLKQMREVIDNNWNDPEFTVKSFNTIMILSKSQLYRKIVALTGLSPNDFIKEYRLKKSLRILSETQRTISEIAYDSGFNSPSYFSKCFQKRYGISPTNFLQLKQV